GVLLREFCRRRLGRRARQFEAIASHREGAGIRRADRLQRNRMALTALRVVHRLIGAVAARRVFLIATTLLCRSTGFWPFQTRRIFQDALRSIPCARRGVALRRQCRRLFLLRRLLRGWLSGVLGEGNAGDSGNENERDCARPE